MSCQTNTGYGGADTEILLEYVRFGGTSIKFNHKESVMPSSSHLLLQKGTRGILPTHPNKGTNYFNYGVIAESCVN